MKTKQKTCIQSAFVTIASALIGLVSASAQTTNWNGSGAWASDSSWDNGVPDASSDAVINAIGTATLAIPGGSTWKTLTATNSQANSTLTLQVTNSTSSSGGAMNVSSSNSGKITFNLPNLGSLTLSGPLNLTTSSSVADGVSLNIGAGNTLNVNGGISFGGNTSGLNNATFFHGSITEAAPATINADLTFNNGSRFLGTADAGNNSSLIINGSVTLQSGGFTGAAAYFNVGRANAGESGFTVKIRDNLSVSAGTAQVRKGRILEVGSATISSSGALVLTGVANATSDAVFRSSGDLDINGGTLNTNNATGTGGGYLLDIGGDFKLHTGSTVALNSTVASGLTTMKLAGNFDISATSLSSGNLNELRLTLDGTAPQTLEAAVVSGNEIFRVAKLTLDTDFVSLVDNYVNVGDNEFFKTGDLVNIGETTLTLNGLQFFVGDMELTAGTYTEFGGSLTVVAVPEPSAVLLLGGSLACLWLVRTRSQKRA